MSATQQRKWLIAYLVYDSSYYEQILLAETHNNPPEDYRSMKDQTNDLFESVARLPPSDQISVLIFHLACVFEKSTEITVIEKSTRSDNVLGIITHIPIAGLSEALRPLEGIGEEPMAKAKSIADIFKYIKDNYSYDSLMVITFGHGCLFGINLTSRKLFDQLVNFSTKVEGQPLKPNEEHEHSLNETYKTVYNEMKHAMDKSPKIGLLIKKVKGMYENSKHKEQIKYLYGKMKDKVSAMLEKHMVMEMNQLADEVMSTSILTNRELFEGVCNTLGDGKKIDVLVMYNCLMQNVYAQYELRKCVEYLVAPVSGIGFPGYDYASVYQAMKTDPSISPKAVAESFIDALHTSTFYNASRDKIKNAWFVAATQLDADLLEKTKIAYADWTAVIIETMAQDSKIKSALSKIIIQTALQTYNLSTNCIPNLKVIDFFVFLSEFLKKIQTTNRLSQDNQQNIVGVIQKLLPLVSQLSGNMKTYWETEFYGRPETDYYTDRNYTDGRGIGIILSVSQFLKFEIMDMIFGVFNGKMIDGIVPSFLDNSKTKDLIAAAKFPY